MTALPPPLTGACADWGGRWLHLPWEAPPLSMNQRLHHMKRARLTADIRQTTAWLARQQRLPRAVRHVHVWLVYCPPTRHRRDTDNLMATLKPAADGLVDAGLVPDDTPEWMTKHMPQIGPRRKPGEVWLRVAWLPPREGDDDE